MNDVRYDFPQRVRTRGACRREVRRLALAYGRCGLRGERATAHYLEQRWRRAMAVATAKGWAGDAGTPAAPWGART